MVRSLTFLVCDRSRVHEAIAIFMIMIWPAGMFYGSLGSSTLLLDSHLLDGCSRFYKLWNRYSVGIVDES